jgi:hypothetical protein
MLVCTSDRIKSILHSPCCQGGVVPFPAMNMSRCSGANNEPKLPHRIGVGVAGRKVINFEDGTVRHSSKNF